MPHPTPPLTDRFRTWLASPVARTDLLQAVKATVAAVVAWLVADSVLGLAQSFLAAWVALLTVHATVHRTLWRGVETVVAVAVGVVLALVVVRLLGASPWSFGLAILVAMLLGRVPGVRTEGLTIPTTVLIVLMTGEVASPERAENLLPDRLLDTVIGVAVALVVNLLVVPPLNDSSARRQVDDVDRELGGLLEDMAAQLGSSVSDEQADDWIERTRSIDADLDHAWSLVRHSAESRLWNPRRRRHPAHVLQGFADVLVRLEEGVAQTRSMARHVRESTRGVDEWDQRFRDRFVTLLGETGRRIAEPGADVADLRDDVRSLVADLSTHDLPGLQWPLYGALLANLRIIVDVVDDVATAQPVRT